MCATPLFLTSVASTSREFMKAGLPASAIGVVPIPGGSICHSASGGKLQELASQRSSAVAEWQAM